MTARIEAGALLAGGQGRRLGGRDKGALTVANQILAERALDKLATHCEKVVVAAPAQPNWLNLSSEISFVADQLDFDGDNIGPAGGLLAALLWAHDKCGRDAWCFVCPVDSPFFPTDLPLLLDAHTNDVDVVLPKTEDGLQPAFGLWRSRLALDIYDLVMDHDMRALRSLAGQFRRSIVDIVAPDHAFLNINTPEDLDLAQQHANLI